MTESMRRWQYEITVREMICIICGQTIVPRTKVAVARYHAKAIVLCHKCENVTRTRLGKMNEEPILTLLGGYYSKKEA